MQAGINIKERLLTNRQFLPNIVVWFVFFLLLSHLAGKYYTVIDQNVYPTLHLVIEFVTIIVAICASLMSWYDYKYKYELRMLIFSLTFCVYVPIEFAHALSYSGMPDFITLNSVNKASTYFIAGRLLLSAGLLTAVLCGDKVYTIRKSALIPAFFALAGAGLVVGIAVYLPHLPAMYDPDAASQTVLKVYLGYTVMIMLGLTAARLLSKQKLNNQDFYLVMAIVLGILSDKAFTQYHSAFDTYNLLGHIYQIFSILFIFKAIIDEAVGFIYESNKILERQSEMLDEKNQRLQEADRLKDEFLANTNHELRTPLTAIIAFTEMMLDESTGKLNNLQKDYLNEINDSSNELLGRINGFLDLSKIAAGKTILYKENIEVGQWIEEVIIRMRPLFKNKSITLDVSIKEGPLYIWADREKAGQILTNLLSNALKFTPHGGKVIVSAEISASGKDLSFSVKDNGIGIEPKNLERIFHPFQQVDGTSSRMYSGTGIGLNLAKKLIDLHDGTIEVSSEINKGSIFTFTLPLQEKDSLGKVG